MAGGGTFGLVVLVLGVDDDLVVVEDDDVVEDHVEVDGGQVDGLEEPEPADALLADDEVGHGGELGVGHLLEHGLAGQHVVLAVLQGGGLTSSIQGGSVAAG